GNPAPVARRFGGQRDQNLHRFGKQALFPVRIFGHSRPLSWRGWSGRRRGRRDRPHALELCAGHPHGGLYRTEVIGIDEMSEDEAHMEDGEVVDELPDERAPIADAQGDRIAALAAELDGAKQDIPYARAETQNVRGRLEKELAEARVYAA